MIITTFFVILTVCGILANLLLILIIARNSQLRKKSTHALLANLAIADVILDVTIIIIGGFNLSNSEDSNPICAFSAFMITFAGSLSLMALLLLAVERFRMLVLVKQTGLNRREQIIAVGFQIGYALLLAILPMAGLGNFVPQPAGVYCAADSKSRQPMDIFYNCVCATTLFGTLIVIAVLYQQALLAVKVSAHDAKPPPIERIKKFTHRRKSTHPREVLLHEKKVTKRMIALVVASFFTWLPYNIDVLYQMISGNESPYWLDLLAIFMVTLGTLSSPCINFKFNLKYRNEVLKMLGRPQSSSVFFVNTPPTDIHSPRIALPQHVVSVSIAPPTSPRLFVVSTSPSPIPVPDG